MSNNNEPHVVIADVYYVPPRFGDVGIAVCMFAYAYTTKQDLAPIVESRAVHLPVWPQGFHYEDIADLPIAVLEAVAKVVPSD